LMPHLSGEEKAEHMHLYDVQKGHGIHANYSSESFTPEHGKTTRTSTSVSTRITSESATLFYPIPSRLSPYLKPEKKAVQGTLSTLFKRYIKFSHQDSVRPPRYFRSLGIWQGLSQESTSSHIASSLESHYGDKLFEEVRKYCERAVSVSSGLDFDLIHAHDWMTYPAAISIAHLSQKPCVLHVHSIESDRSGDCKNEGISAIEYESLHAADSIIAVSHYTKDKLIEEYGINPDKIKVVHNGVQGRTKIKTARKQDGQFHVLFLGRVTFQKGPDYFIEAALKVLAILPNTHFTLAGDGDMLDQLKLRVKKAKLEKHFFMPGFLKGREVDQAFVDADLYVMPSVSEPFGISALEALYYNVPIIVSRQSGISEVIRHALKADFWDVDELANLMIGALKYPELRRDLLQMATQELKSLDWDHSAENVIQVYQTLVRT